MAAEAHIFPDQNTVVSKFKGDLTDELLETYYGQLLSIPGGSTEFAEIVDLCEVTHVHVSESGLARVAVKIDQAYAAATHRLRCAVVAPTDLAFGLSRLYEGALSPDVIDLQVFRAVTPALAWLGIDSPSLTTAWDNLTPESPSLLFHCEPASQGIRSR